MAEEFVASTVVARLNAWLYTNLQRDINRLQTRLEHTIVEMEQHFFRDLVAKCINRASSPTLNEFRPSWHPLTPKYKRWKIKRGRSPNFFVNTGELQTVLGSLNATTVLGRPIAIYSAETRRGVVSVARISFVNRFGRVQTQGRVIKGTTGSTGGRFARKQDVFEVIPENIEIRPFSNVDTYDHIEAKIFAERSKDYYKLTGRQKYYRPMVGPYMKFWMKYRLKPELDRILGQ